MDFCYTNRHEFCHNPQEMEAKAEVPFSMQMPGSGKADRDVVAEGGKGKSAGGGAAGGAGDGSVMDQLGSILVWCLVLPSPWIPSHDSMVLG
jgi:hypothetical protein